MMENLCAACVAEGAPFGRRKTEFETLWPIIRLRDVLSVSQRSPLMPNLQAIEAFIVIGSGIVMIQAVLLSLAFMAPFRGMK